MALSLFQKIRLAFRGWSRRSEEAASRRNDDFLRREASWGAPKTIEVTQGAPKQTSSPVDLEGLQVAWLDDSGAIDHYLDLVSGDVVEFLAEQTHRRAEVEADPKRYRRVPRRSSETDADDRAAFARGVERQEMRMKLMTALGEEDPAAAFRKALSSDRAVERAWYSFKNDRASEAIARWLETMH
ncbi:MAG TPA: UPF0158 family protein [Thermoanaerobaculia bacterium]|nr:UPF0158 family protein [Thermoanaerobaculia bacterium]